MSRVGRAIVGRVIVIVIISDDRATKMTGGRGLGMHKAREDLVAWRTAQNANVGCGRSRHRGSVLASIPDKLDLISKVDGIGASQILSLLTVVLRGENAHRARWNVIRVTNSKGPAMARVIEDVPQDGADSGGACGTVETFDTNCGSRRRLHEVGEGVGDTRSGTTIDQDVEGVRIEDCMRAFAVRKC
jgi:hypothetical protein